MAEIKQAGVYQLGCLYDGALLRVRAGVVKSILYYASNTGINAELPEFSFKIYDRSVEVG